MPQLWVIKERIAQEAAEIFAARFILVENFFMNRVDTKPLTGSLTNTRVKNVQSQATLPPSLLRVSVPTRLAIIALISVLLWFAILWALG
jgi:hypothetical protein